MNKTQMILAPLSVLVFVIILTIMYGWVDTIEIVSEEMPEVNPAARLQTPNPPNQLIDNPTIPSGIGNGQIQLINNPTISSGIGNGQILLINQAVPGTPYLGITAGEVPQLVAKDLKLAPGTGIYVKNITRSSPADKAGIKPGDIILKFDHQPVTSHEQISRITRTKKINTAIKILVNRDGRKKSFHVKLEKAPNGLIQVAAVQKKIWLGADIQDIDEIMKMQFSLPDTRGVIVSHVSENSPAEKSGLLTGDVIRRFRGTRVRDVSQFQSLILKQHPGKQMQLLVLRNQKQLTLPLVLGEQTPVAPKIPFIGPADIAIEGSWIGMDVSELTANGAASHGLPTATRGILVNDVESPPATMLGFVTGDVLMAINGTPTPDMKHFLEATKKQQRAVVDVIRGNKHFFISVPPPGFTQQGTKISTPLDNKLKQVAMVQPMVIPWNSGLTHRLGIFSSGSDINDSVAENIIDHPYLIMVDFDKDSFAVLPPYSRGNLADMFRQYNLSALVCGSVSRQTAANLSVGGVIIYSGVVGTIQNSIRLYESGCLTASKGY